MNRDDELYALVPDGKATWCIVNEDNIEIIKISDTDIKNICENICNKDFIESYSIEGFIERVWEELRDNEFPDIVDYMYTENWDKFSAWFDYTCVEYLTQETIAIFKQKLLNFE